MKIIKNLLVTLLFTLALMCIIGCKSDLVADASGSLFEENVIAEVKPTPQEITTIEEDTRGNHIQWWRGEWKTEYITNCAGKELELHYMESVVWPESEEETLAKFLKSEEGTYEEKTRIAQLLVWRKSQEEYPDTIQDILKFNDYFLINPEFWNEMADPTDEDLEIAKAVLESAEEKPEYVHYFFREFYEEEFEKNEPEIKVYKTENYVFYN